MSSQKGNASRSRPQKYQNRHAFKNNLHDTSHKTKFINSIDVANVCERCKHIIEWKIKYKKYKPLKAPSKCVKCEQKTVKHAYHIMCSACARERRVCPKCGTKGELVTAKPTVEEQVKLDTELQAMLKALPERKRRTFVRYMNQKGTNLQRFNNERVIIEVLSDKPSKRNTKDSAELQEDEEEDADVDVAQPPRTREELFEKLKSLNLANGDKDDTSDFGSDYDEDEDDLDSEED